VPQPTNGASSSNGSWAPASWRQRTAHQQPKYPDRAEVDKACNEIRSYPPLIFAGECRNLQERLAKAVTGDAFILMGGDCAEAFSQFSANRIRDTYRVLLQMSVVMMFGGGVPVIKLGRMAGQFAKPR
jgi:3-deoxy-7-phosphoheptulonate synthase